MVKKKKDTYSALQIIISIIILLLIYVLIPYYNYDSDYGLPSVEDDFSDMDEFHFPKMPITYDMYIDTGADNDVYEANRIRWAFEIIEDSTDGLVRFEKAGYNEPANLIINGLPPLEIESSELYVVEGLAGPVKLENNIILQSELDFYPSISGLYGSTTELYIEGGWLWESTSYDYIESLTWEYGDCSDLPVTEIHEILHALGFGHIEKDSHSVMFPVKHRIQACKTTEIDKEIISCLKHIYSNGDVSGDCSKLDLYPFEEEIDEERNDFIWESLPVRYSISDCNRLQERNIQKAEKVIEDYIGYELYNLVGADNSQINFKCQDSIDDVILNRETDFWDETVYFPSAQPYFNKNEEGIIEDVEILLFAQNRKCGGIEVHQLLHGLGLRKHYGQWMGYEVEMCDTKNMVLSRDTKERIIELYGLEGL